MNVMNYLYEYVLLLLNVYFYIRQSKSELFSEQIKQYLINFLRLIMPVRYVLRFQFNYFMLISVVITSFYSLSKVFFN